ncbi:MAG: C39 family peptidase [Chloroflexota bacterium]|nr:C39 family peptidase [Chloroflexota bacterium]
MMLKLVSVAILGLLLTTLLPASALEVASAARVMPDLGGGYVSERRPPSRPAIRFVPAPDRWSLGQLPYEAQRMNNCGPVSTNMVLGHYGIHLSQVYTASKLRPDPSDVAVDDIEMVTFAKVEYGYGGEVRWGGNMRLIETFVANDIPVIVLQLLAPDSDIDHFRVVHGYDRVRRTVTLSDSYLGRDLNWSYAYFDNLWKRRGYEYAVIYPRGKAALVRAITQRYRTNDRTSERDGIRRAREYIRSAPGDPWGWLRLGQLLYHWGHYREALTVWEHAKTLGLPKKSLWYTEWPMQLLNRMGRHQEARELASDAIAKDPSSSEAYYERARATHALGNTLQAGNDLRRALALAPYNPHVRGTYAEYAHGHWAQ